MSEHNPATCDMGLLECRVKSTFIDRTRYKVVRMYFKGGKRTILDNLTLEQAQAHCSDPETSSSTCTKSVGRARTRRMGAWFDGYSEDN